MNSGVMPLHNEALFLPFSLQALKHADLGELVVVLDRCTDESERLIDIFTGQASFPVRKYVLSEREWGNPTSEVFKMGFEKAQGDVVYSLAGDCIYDPRIFQICWANLDFASFHYYDFPLGKGLLDKLHSLWVNFLKRILNIYLPHLTKQTKFSGIYAFQKRFFNRLNPLDVQSEDVWYFQQALNLKVKYRHFTQFRNIHMRPATIGFAEKQKAHGTGKQALNYPLWKVVAHSVLLIKPHTLKAYIHARARGSVEN